jgi:hypothetical protein
MGSWKKCVVIIQSKDIIINRDLAKIKGISKFTRLDFNLHIIFLLHIERESKFLKLFLYNTLNLEMLLLPN